MHRTQDNVYHLDVLCLAPAPSAMWRISRSQEGNIIDKESLKKKKKESLTPGT